MPKMLRGRFWFDGFSDKERLIIARVNPKMQFRDGKPTDVAEAVRITALMQNGEEINVDLRPFTKEKLERCKGWFSESFTASNLIGVENCTIFTYKEDIRVTVTATDIQLQNDPWEVKL